MPEHTRPADIENTSMSIIAQELDAKGVTLDPIHGPIVRRVIHATADFDFAGTLQFTHRAVPLAVEALRRGTTIVTDTNMALAGISRPSLQALGCQAHCLMAEESVVQMAKEQGTTRASAAMELARQRWPGAILAVGNAPTALFKIEEQLRQGLRPALVIAVPVGFVNVVESKKRIWETCQALQIPAIAAMGRKGGSTVAVAILNGLLYTAASTLDPSARGWQ